MPGDRPPSRLSALPSGSAVPHFLGYGWRTEVDVARVAARVTPGGPPSNGEEKTGMSSSGRADQVSDAGCAGRPRQDPGSAVA